MRIARHPVDEKRVAVVFKAEIGSLGESLRHAREKPRMLYLFFRQVEGIYQAGGVLYQDSPEVGRALVLAAQAGAAIFTCQGPGAPRPFQLGEGPPVAYADPVSRSYADYPTWMKVFHLCLTTRQRHLADAVCRVPNEVFRGSDIVGAETEDYTFADMLRAVWRQERFTADPAFAKVEATCQGQPKSAAYVHGVTVPYLRALRHLERGDAAGFGSAWAEALRGHKKFWSAKSRRDEFGGFVSPMLTSAAALAWDRGLRFDVESDYAPTSWVRGELFRLPPEQRPRG